MVEAVGIEPTSENALTRASTYLAYTLDLAFQSPAGGVSGGQPGKVFPVSLPDSSTRGIPLIDVLQAPAGTEPKDAGCLSSQSVIVVVADYSLLVFNEPQTSVCFPRYRFTPSKPVAPIRLFALSLKESISKNNYTLYLTITEALMQKTPSGATSRQSPCLPGHLRSPKCRHGR